MAASARRKSSQAIAVPAKPSKIRLAHGGDTASATPVHDQQLMLETAFSAPHEQPYPIVVKAMLFIGVPTALWAGIIFAGAQLLRLTAS